VKPERSREEEWLAIVAVVLYAVAVMMLAWVVW
jgi:hypothetical protein